MLRLTTLGGIDLRADGGGERAAVLRQPKRVILMAYLAIVGRERYVRRDELVALFWPELDNEHARSALRTALSRLRTALEADPFVARGIEELRIDREVLWCDAAAFLDTCAERQLDKALALYRGDLLEGVHASDASHDLERWIDRERARLKSLAAGTAWSVVDREEATQRPREAIAAARRALTLAPLDEPGLRRLMSLLMTVGDRAAALDAYSEFTRRLASELEASPSDETRTAMLAIRGEGVPSPVIAPRGLHNQETSRPLRREPVLQQAVPARRWSRATLLTLAAAVLVLLGSVWTSRGRLIALGALDALPAPAFDSAPRWRRMDMRHQPLPRYHHRMVLDRSGDTAVMFGGRAGANLFGDLWRLTGIVGRTPSWTRMHPEDGLAPPPRWLHGLAYSSASDRMILFGGALGHTWPCANDLWLLEGMTHGPMKWRQLGSKGPPPAPRAEPSAVYDAASNRLIVFGGHDCIATRFNDLWLLWFADGTNGETRWQRIEPRAVHGIPAPRSGHSASYDPVSNRLIVYGGTDGEKQHDDVWLLLHANGTGGDPEWVPLPTDGLGPPARAYHAAGYDPSTNTMVVFGGLVGETGRTSQSWTLADANGAHGRARWRELVFSGSVPAARYVHTAVFDAVRQQLLIFGGIGATDEKPFVDSWLLRNATNK